MTVVIGRVSIIVTTPTITLTHHHSSHPLSITPIITHYPKPSHPSSHTKVPQDLHPPSHQNHTHFTPTLPHSLIHITPTIKHLYIHLHTYSPKQLPPLPSSRRKNPPPPQPHSPPVHPPQPPSLSPAPRLPPCHPPTSDSNGALWNINTLDKRPAKQINHSP